MDHKDLDKPQHALAEAYAYAHLTYEELWLRYFAIGGDMGLVEIEAYLVGLMSVSKMQHNMLATAVNERLDEIGPPRHAPFLE